MTTYNTDDKTIGHVLNVLSSIAYDLEQGNGIDEHDGEDIKRCIKMLTGENWNSHFRYYLFNQGIITRIEGSK